MPTTIHTAALFLSIGLIARWFYSFADKGFLPVTALRTRIKLNQEECFIW
jgi:hypothetical protein